MRPQALWSDALCNMLCIGQTVPLDPGARTLPPETALRRSAQATRCSALLAGPRSTGKTRVARTILVTAVPDAPITGATDNPSIVRKLVNGARWTVQTAIGPFRQRLIFPPFALTCLRHILLSHRESLVPLDCDKSPIFEIQEAGISAATQFVGRKNGLYSFPSSRDRLIDRGCHTPRRVLLHL